MNQDTPASLAEGRSKIYWLLARFYLEQPSPRFLEELRRQFSSAAVVGAEPPGREIQALLDALQGTNGKDQVLHLQREHTRLFAGLSREGLPPPYESLHRENQLMGSVTVDASRHYQRAGYGDILPDTGPQDHIAVELRFMALLCFDECVAWGSDDEDSAHHCRAHQQDFLHRHLLPWVPAYCGRLAAESREPFYSAAARLTSAALQMDDTMLQDLVAA